VKKRGSMHHEILIDILLLLTVTVMVVGLFRRLRIPANIGYLTVGLVIGPNGFSWLSDAAEIHFMAELGVDTAFRSRDMLVSCGFIGGPGGIRGVSACRCGSEADAKHRAERGDCAGLKAADVA
jgi:hypothetical protein